jgi:hypothetical protein
MLRLLCIAVCVLLFAPSVRAQTRSTTTTSCERNARGTKETCTTVDPQTTVTTVCTLHRGRWVWQSSKGTCTTTEAPTTSGDALLPQGRGKRDDVRSDFTARYAALRYDYAYGDSLLKAAATRGDTAAVRQFTSDQAQMMAQIVAMSDTALSR